MLYLWLRGLHYTLAWTGVYVGLAFFGVGLYIGVVQKRDVTRLFRRTVYFIAATMVAQALIGLYLWYGVGVRPQAEAHWIYGFGTAVALPFFAFIERTAEKRPAMGSYLWGFGMLVAIGFRSILTG
ncbi:MAG: hypothetical protein ACOYL5_06290 [Phototrophicaceae bacterium]|jgi:hypothetical protein